MNKDLKEHIIAKNLFNKKETIVLALSGGVDSMVLFNILYRCDLDLNIIVAHVNHKKRVESNFEYNEISLMCQHKNVIFEGFELQNISKGNFHEESRRLRYDFFEKTAVKHNAKKIVLAHHADDQIETIFMRIVRGSSFIGYAGIKEWRISHGFTYVRPLIDVAKSVIQEYAKENDITHYEDKSNSELFYTRNRFRNQIIPLMREENPHLEKKIKQFSSYINMADDFINQERDKFLDTSFITGEINIEEFNKLSAILKIKVLKFTINSKSYDTVEVSFKQYEDMIELLSNENPNITYNLSNDFALVKVYSNFYIDKLLQTESVLIEINDFGEYIISQDTKYIFSQEKLGIYNEDNCEIWYNKKVFPLYLRNRRNGDRMSLSVGTKKVKDILIDQKIPQKIRENLILIASRDKVLWIPNIKKSLQDKTCKNKLYVYEVK